MDLATKGSFVSGGFIKYLLSSTKDKGPRTK
jgi:hypothetical protein